MEGWRYKKIRESLPYEVKSNIAGAVLTIASAGVGLLTEVLPNLLTRYNYKSLIRGIKTLEAGLRRVENGEKISEVFSEQDLLDLQELVDKKPTKKNSNTNPLPSKKAELISLIQLLHRQADEKVIHYTDKWGILHKNPKFIVKTITTLFFGLWFGSSLSVSSPWKEVAKFEIIPSAKPLSLKTAIFNPGETAIENFSTRVRDLIPLDRPNSDDLSEKLPLTSDSANASKKPVFLLDGITKDSPEYFGGQSHYFRLSDGGSLNYEQSPEIKLNDKTFSADSLPSLTKFARSTFIPQHLEQVNSSPELQKLVNDSLDPAVDFNTRPRVLNLSHPGNYAVIHNIFSYDTIDGNIIGPTNIIFTNPEIQKHLDFSKAQMKPNNILVVPFLHPNSKQILETIEKKSPEISSKTVELKKFDPLIEYEKYFEQNDNSFSIAINIDKVNTNSKNVIFKFKDGSTLSLYEIELKSKSYELGKIRQYESGLAFIKPDKGFKKKFEQLESIQITYKPIKQQIPIYFTNYITAKPYEFTRSDTPEGDAIKDLSGKILIIGATKRQTYIPGSLDDIPKAWGAQNNGDRVNSPTFGTKSYQADIKATLVNNSRVINPNLIQTTETKPRSPEQLKKLDQIVESFPPNLRFKILTWKTQISKYQVESVDGYTESRILYKIQNKQDIIDLVEEIKNTIKNGTEYGENKPLNEILNNNFNNQEAVLQAIAQALNNKESLSCAPANDLEAFILYYLNIPNVAVNGYLNLEEKEKLSINEKHRYTIAKIVFDDQSSMAILSDATPSRRENTNLVIKSFSGFLSIVADVSSQTWKGYNQFIQQDIIEADPKDILAILIPYSVAIFGTLLLLKFRFKLNNFTEPVMLELLEFFDKDKYPKPETAKTVLAQILDRTREYIEENSENKLDKYDALISLGRIEDLCNYLITFSGLVQKEVSILGYILNDIVLDNNSNLALSTRFAENSSEQNPKTYQFLEQKYSKLLSPNYNPLPISRKDVLQRLAKLQTSNHEVIHEALENTINFLKQKQTQENFSNLDKICKILESLKT